MPVHLPQARCQSPLQQPRQGTIDPCLAIFTDTENRQERITMSGTVSSLHISSQLHVLLHEGDGISRNPHLGLHLLIAEEQSPCLYGTPLHVGGQRHIIGIVMRGGAYGTLPGIGLEGRSAVGASHILSVHLQSSPGSLKPTLAGEGDAEVRTHAPATP